MTRQWKRWAAGLAVRWLDPCATTAARAWAPAIPAVPAAWTAAPNRGHDQVTECSHRRPQNLWSFLCMTPDQKAACKARFCNSAIGKMMTSMSGPLQLSTGGLLGNFCPKGPTAADLAQPADERPGGRRPLESSSRKPRKQETPRGRALPGHRRLPALPGGGVGPHRQSARRHERMRALRGRPGPAARLLLHQARHRGACAILSTAARRGSQPRLRRVFAKRAREALDHCLATRPAGDRTCVAGKSVRPPEPPSR